jgi:hypothetical protein
MRKEEANLIYNVISGLPESFTILNIGSSSKDFREERQPHVGDLFHSLTINGNKVEHLDVKKEKGVDIVLNIFDKDERNGFDFNRFDFYLVSNLLEHLDVEYLANFSSVLDSIMKSDDYFLIIQPSSYPIHFDPIDNYYRPDSNVLKDLMNDNFHVISSGEVLSSTFLQDFLATTFRLKLRTIVTLFCPFFRFKAWLGNWHRLLWLNYRYKSSYCLFQKVN